MILGGGPAGVSLAFYAQRMGLDFRLLEKDSQLGGLCQTLQAGEHCYDTGAHRFHDRHPHVTRDLEKILGDSLHLVDRPSKVWLDNRLLEFPPTPLNMLFSLGMAQVGRIGLDLIRARSRDSEVVSFADYATRQFGRTLAEKFLLNYTAKVWGLPSDELSPAVATRRLSGMKIRSLLVELLAPARRTKHLDGNFLYPKGGYGKIVQALAGELPEEKVSTDEEVVGFSIRGNRVEEIHLGTGDSLEVPGSIVSTIPLTILIRFLRDHIDDEILELARSLRFRDIRLIFLRLNLSRFSENASIYIPDPDVMISRIYEPKNRCESMSPVEETSLVAEIPCYPEDEKGQLSDEALYKSVVSDLSRLGLVEADKILEWKHHWLPNAYPVYSIDFSEKVDRLLKALSPFQNLNTLGRNGLFFYSHLHDQMHFAQEFIEDLLEVDSCA